MPKKKSKGDLIKLRSAIIDGKTIYEHEAIYAKFTNKPIPKGHLVFHIDNNTLNNHPKNLMVGLEKDSDYHIDKNKIFHEDQIEENIPFIKKHFKDVYDALDLGNYKKETETETEKVVVDSDRLESDLMKYLSDKK